MLITATLNCLSPLLRTRQAISNRILPALLSFNPLKHAHPQMSLKDKVQVKSVERTIRMLFLNFLRRYAMLRSTAKEMVLIDLGPKTGRRQRRSNSTLNALSKLAMRYSMKIAAREVFQQSPRTASTTRSAHALEQKFRQELNRHLCHQAQQV